MPTIESIAQESMATFELVLPMTSTLRFLAASSALPVSFVVEGSVWWTTGLPVSNRKTSSPHFVTLNLLPEDRRGEVVPFSLSAPDLLR
jgi:hypothetical protein